ncbi:MAG: ATP-binding protein [Burkholderiales bacterium]|nr:ATP-binding protein [Burkholderiales bacterium]
MKKAAALEALTVAAPATSSAPSGSRISVLAKLLPAGLARRFTATMVLLVTVALLFNGAVNMTLSYKEATAAAIEVQREKAIAAAERMLQFIEGIETQIGWTTRAEWARVSLDQRRYDFIRLLRQSPPITEVIQIDGAGKEQLRFSRLEPDVIGSGADLSNDPRFTQAVANKVWYGPVYFRRGSEPYMTLSMAHAGRNAGVTSAGVNLKLVWDVITAIRVGETGYAYVTDDTGKLVTHPDMSLVLRGADLSSLPQVAAAMANRKGEAKGGDGRASIPTRVTGLDGRTVLSSHAVVPRLGWIVFVELPVREVLAPVFTSLYQTLALLALGILLAIVLGALLASRLLVPIKLLQAGAQRLGEGDLSQRIPVTSGDEIGTLARRFNDMAGRIQEAQETLEAKVDARTQQLTASLEDLRAAQDRLVQTEKLASLGQLTAGIAHEIKNPLNFVNNFAELSAELVEELNETLEPSAGALPEEVRRDLADITGLLKDNLGRVVQHGKRADSIVRNMLLHARHGVEERREVDLNALVDEALNLAYHGARAETASFNITLKRDYDPAVGKVSLFPQEFTRVLLNLIGNGFHAASKRLAQEQAPGGDPTFEPTLTVTTRSRGERVRIKIRDNGTGIPEDIRARIFEPFFTTKPAGEGTGLGLSISHDIIAKQHGGKIDVMSKPGEFTEFFITLPRDAKKPGGEA